MTKIIRVCVGAPRRARQKRLVGAPPYVLAIYDEGEEYTVIFGWPLWEPRMGRTLPCLHFNALPNHPACGVSMWGEVGGRWGRNRSTGQNSPPTCSSTSLAGPTTRTR